MLLSLGVKCSNLSLLIAKQYGLGELIAAGEQVKVEKLTLGLGIIRLDLMTLNSDIKERRSRRSTGKSKRRKWTGRSIGAVVCEIVQSECYALWRLEERRKLHPPTSATRARWYRPERVLGVSLVSSDNYVGMVLFGGIQRETKAWQSTSRGQYPISYILLKIDICIHFI